MKWTFYCFSFYLMTVTSKQVRYGAFTQESPASPVEVAKPKPSQIINPYKYSFIIQTPPCAPDVELLIVIHSSVQVCYTNYNKNNKNHRSR